VFAKILLKLVRGPLADLLSDLIDELFEFLAEEVEVQVPAGETPSLFERNLTEAERKVANELLAAAEARLRELLRERLGVDVDPE
jgi:hypothetical protein